MTEAWRGHGQVVCGVCRDMLLVGVEQAAVLAARATSPDGRQALCHRHLGDMLADVPDSSRAGAVASLLDAAAAAVAEGREIPACAVCSRQADVAERPSSGALCLHHLRGLVGRLAWDALSRGASRLIGVMARDRGRGQLAALWGSAGLVGAGDGDDACSICAARAEARSRQFEWLADTVRRFPAQAAGAAVAVCSAHAWTFAAFSPASGRMLADLAAHEWTGRLRRLQAGLEDRPPDRLSARLAALPATLAGLADDEGRLHIAVILRAAAAAALRTPGAALADLTAAALDAERCPICAAEDRAARAAAASGDAVVCPTDLRLVRSANPDRRARRALTRATAGRLRREAAGVRGGDGSVRRASSLAAVTPIRW